MEAACEDCRKPGKEEEEDEEAFNEEEDLYNVAPPPLPMPPAGLSKLGGFEFFQKVLGSPKHIVAPMVDQSELPFRMLCRRYDANLCYTPMLHAKHFANSHKYRRRYFTSHPDDRTLVVQFCANDPAWLLAAATHVQDNCDAVDINLGCPQNIAKRGNYGAFLMEQADTVLSLVRTLHQHLRVPVFCKMRVWTDMDRTIAFAKALEEAGCQLLAVHGRTREMKGSVMGLADWKAIKQVKEALSIPVLANGNIRHAQDVRDCLAATGADGVMSAEGLLRNPALFSGKTLTPFQLALEYLELCETYPSERGWMRNHLCKILYEYVETEHFRATLFGTKTAQDMREAVLKLQASVASGEVVAKVPYRYAGAAAGVRPKNKAMDEAALGDIFAEA